VEEERGPKQKRPFLATECRDLNEADKWRQQILREIGKKVMEIQNASLGEHRCVRSSKWSVGGRV
jgi:pre-mRNA-splicing factor ISY1